MRITQRQLKRIIKEEVARALRRPGARALLEAKYDEGEDALKRLKVLAREAADDWMAENPNGDIWDVAYDLAEQLQDWSYDTDWNDAIDYFGSRSDLVQALADEMTG